MHILKPSASTRQPQEKMQSNREECLRQSFETQKFHGRVDEDAVEQIKKQIRQPGKDKKKKKEKRKHTTTIKYDNIIEENIWSFSRRIGY